MWHTCLFSISGSSILTGPLVANFDRCLCGEGRRHTCLFWLWGFSTLTGCLGSSRGSAPIFRMWHTCRFSISGSSILTGPLVANFDRCPGGEGRRHTCLFWLCRFSTLTGVLGSNIGSAPDFSLWHTCLFSISGSSILTGPLGAGFDRCLGGEGRRHTCKFWLS
jgi:hypothetical protein